MKYKILKAIDVSGLTFLAPIVRLATGEEPDVQIRAIMQMIVVPIVAFAVFVGLWSQLAPRHKTKSGEVPTPAVVWDAAQGIWTFHAREGDKETAYVLAGEQRESALMAAKDRLAEIDPLTELADRQVADAEQEKSAQVAELTAPLRTKLAVVSERYGADQAARKARWMERADRTAVSDTDARLALLGAWNEHDLRTREEREELKNLRAEIDTVGAQAFPALSAAQKAQTAIAEERQFLRKRIEVLTAYNRNEKARAGEQQLADLRSKYLQADGGAAMAGLAANIARTRTRVESIRESNYARPYTLPMQILRSLLCVFVGFLLGSLIAIPIGILCGLSPTFMAAMMPFIALFKPVSPIVWLPIALIVVGGFIPDPDDHWLINGFAGLPLVGWMKINPAFLASAITVALCSMWATMVNTALGVASIDDDHTNVARMLRLSARERLFRIVLPSALPLIFAGLRISLSVGWMVLIAAELLSSSEGIGKYVWDMFNNGASDSFAKMFVVVFVVGSIGLALDRIMIVFQRLVSFDGAPTAI